MAICWSLKTRVNSFIACGDVCADVAYESMKAAHEAGSIVSYDLNFRSKLWSSRKAIEVTKKLIPYIDVLISNEEDFQKVLGIVYAFVFLSSPSWILYKCVT
jgi:sugar/nucleoside kinase (ribokinase family)